MHQTGPTKNHKKELKQSRKYYMRPLENIISLEEFTLMREGKDTSLSSRPWWSGCISQVKLWIYQDRTTTRDTLYQKAENYAKNYLCNIPEVASINKDDVVKKIADEVESELEDVSFDQRPPAYVVAQNARFSIPEDPERKYIRLR